MVSLFKKKANEEGKFKCDYCKMEFTEKVRLERHRRKAHGKGSSDLPNTNPFSF